ncbi:MAG: ferric reductase-like transmembrane domain-containing protein [Candidatus Pacebacteria bacterium]|nr:ferric reductase-like transmembrane domain-containing protein [Candidatus Paceibacterota bacterium]
MLSHSTRSHIGLVMVILLCLFPIVPWLTMKPLDLRFGSFVMWATSIGQLTALLGFAMFSVSLILISRLKWLEAYFGGLDRIFQIHRHLGFIGFLLMLIHPLALATAFVPVSVASAALFLLPTGSDVLKTLGVMALLMMMSLVAITLYAHWRYQVLLKTHKILGIAFMLGAVHAIFIPSDISNNTALTVYCGGLAFFALSAYVYRTVFAHAVPKHTFSVKEVRSLGVGVTEVVLDPVDAPLVFDPGQFVFVSFKNGGVSSEVHPFTISSAPHERELRLTIKALGDWTSEVPCLAKGADALIEGPFGGFTESSACRDAEVWVAGGIGITPFLSRARALTSRGLTKPVDLYYTANVREDMLFLRELQLIAQRFPSFRVVPYASKELGFLNAAVLQKQSGPLVDKDVFVCGPPSMMQGLIRQCKDLGVRSSQIHAEEFSML